MRKALFIAILPIIASMGATAKVIEVCASCAHQSIQQAVEAADSLDDIRVLKGRYLTQEVVIEKQISICGESGSVIDGGGKTIFYVHHNGVSLTNLNLQNVATSYVEDRAAIKCNNSDNVHFKNLHISNAFFGILVEKSDHGVIEECEVIGKVTKETYLESSSGNAIHLWYCNNMSIQNNTVKFHRDGIYFEFVKQSIIENNLSDGNLRYGLHFMFSHGNAYRHNRFIRNGAGVAVMYSSEVLMERNEFVDNWGESAYGLLLKDITDSELKHNRFRNNTIAISADNSLRVKIAFNQFDKNGYALRIMGNCMDNTLENNDFLQNSFDVVTNTSKNYNTFNHNYWEEYRGYDLDGDGVGDVPYRPVKLFSYIIAQSQPAIILMRSSFINLLDLAEKVTPVLTPETLMDNQPVMRPINDRIKEGI
ncbi:MAG: nitrous oxide reductase family maturation protein NosD [Flavobacteriales bacterium]|nr:nitrous oxide reductase family maturation protein NosD [Bacteroidota bacterium]MCB9241302.1 nitrous oxide reductase family maturation protein NosD [Flavobacteriales bacterium]